MRYTSAFSAAAVTTFFAPCVVAIEPKAMLSANQYSDAMPNPSGDFALFTVSNYSFETQETMSVWNRLDLKSGDISTWHVGDDISELVFVGPESTSILYLNSTNEAEDGGVSLYTADADSLENATLVASLPAPYSGLKAAETSSGNIRFLLSAQAYENGTAYNEDLAAPSASTGRVYTSIFIRHWDHYITDEKYAVFGGELKKKGGSFSLQGNLTNYVTGICNVTCAESPLDNSGPDDYDLSPDGSKVAFLTKDIDLPLANYTSSQVYVVPFDGTADDATPVNPRGKGKYRDAQGASSGPKFSPESDKLAYVQMSGISYESDRTILYVADVGNNGSVTRLAGDWDRSPGSATWSKDGSTIFVAAEDRGRTRIFPIPADTSDSFTPKNITNEGTPSGFHALSDGKLLVTDTKIWSSCDIFSVSDDGDIDQVFFEANKVDKELEGLGPEDVSEFYFKTNSSESEMQAWLIYPEGFQENKTYPLAFITHGGPQGSHANSWSRRWNLKTWADQGYVVVAPNPTASTGFGQNLTDAVQGNWGSYPYWDLVHCWRHVKDHFPYIDTDNGIEAGASFGGYMTNWMQGHEMGRWFKALVTHDGSTQTLNQYASEELWFMDHDFEGPFNETAFSSGSPYYDWNPVLYVDNWATPHLVIHSELDYRLPIAEGIMLFNLLQVKGVPSKMLYFPDENHWVLNPENSLVWHHEIFDVSVYYPDYWTMLIDKWINHYSGISKD